jgi:hypothetical protein
MGLARFIQQLKVLKLLGFLFVIVTCIGSSVYRIAFDTIERERERAESVIISFTKREKGE